MKYQELVNEIALQDKAIQSIDEQIVLCQDEMEKTNFHLYKLLKEKERLKDDLAKYQSHKKNTRIFDFYMIIMLALTAVAFVYLIASPHLAITDPGFILDLFFQGMPFAIGVIGDIILLKGTLKSRKYVKEKGPDFESKTKARQKENEKEHTTTQEFLKRLEASNQDLQTKKENAVAYRNSLTDGFIKAYQEVATEDMKKLDFPIDKENYKVMVKK